MKPYLRTLIGACAALSLVLGLAPASAEPVLVPTDTLLKESKEQKDARMAWWRDARFGMFIHWGLYAVPAGIHEGQPVKRKIGEWIMHSKQIPVAEYEKYAAQFNPVKYDAEEWVKIAKDAGMKYIVITSKHHDGFCLWDSKVSDYDVVDATPYKKDLLKPLAEACKKHGLKLCFYHSIMDWHHPWANKEEWNRKANNPTKQWDKYRDHYLVPQLEELLANYGEIGVIWFDGEWVKDWTEPQGKGLYNLLRSIQPNLIINNRVGKGRKGMAGMNKDASYSGDFGTPEQEIPDQGMPGVDWESCMTMNDTWGYRSDDHNWKSSSKMIRQLIDTSSKGGNFLLNVGPTAEGLIPAPSVERLKAMGEWMKLNSEAIYGSGPSPYEIPKWGRYTTKPGKLYAHVFDWPKDGEILIPDQDLNVAKAYLLADPSRKALNFLDGENGVAIHLPDKALDQAATVVVIETE